MIPSRFPPLLGVLLLLCALFIAPAAAVENIEYTDARVINVEAPEDGVISSIVCADIPGDGEVTLNLNSYGRMYLLTVKESGSWGWWNFNVSCTYPNGTTISKELSTLHPTAADYDLAIQPYWISGVNSMYFDVDVDIGLLPLTVTLQDAYNPTTVQDLAFSQVSGSFSEPTDVTVFIASEDEWEKQASDDPLGAISEGLSDLFAWTWDQVLSNLEKIPGVGSLFVQIIEISTVVVTEIIWAIQTIAEYRNLLILLVEFWIISDAMMHTSSLMGLLKRIVKNHERVIFGLIHFVEITVGIITRIVNAVAAMVQAIKPL